MKFCSVFLSYGTGRKDGRTDMDKTISLRLRRVLINTEGRSFLIKDQIKEIKLANLVYLSQLMCSNAILKHCLMLPNTGFSGMFVSTDSE